MTWQRTMLIVCLLAIAALVMIVSDPEKFGPFRDLVLVALGFGAGAPLPTTTKNRGNKLLHLMLLLICGSVAAVTLVGCTASTTTTIDADGVNQTNQPAQTAVLDATGEGPKITSNYNGVGATNWMQDSDGMWGVTPGPGGMLTFDPASNKIYFWSPKDATIGKLQFTPDPKPGEPKLLVENLTLNMSNPLAQQVAALQIVATAIQNMTQEEAKVKIQALQTAGQITKDIADLALQIIVPHLPSGD